MIYACFYHEVSSVCKTRGITSNGKLRAQCMQKTFPLPTNVLVYTFEVETLMWNISSTQPNLEKNWSNKWPRFTWSLWNSHQFKWKNLSNLHMSWVIMMRKKYDSKYNISLQRIIIMKPLTFITQCYDMWKVQKYVGNQTIMKWKTYVRKGYKTC